MMIPATDTPGAIGAGVPAFMREMLARVGIARRRATDIASVLEAIEKQAWSRFGAAFLEMPPERRLEVRDANSTPTRIGAHDGAIASSSGWCCVGYYHSEVGATQELRFELVPGAWRACLPLAEVGRASAFVLSPAQSWTSTQSSSAPG